jgi:hypothetical protein
MSFLSDLDHLKIETIFQPDHVCTPGFFSDPRKGIRKAKIEQKWYRKKSLGIGSFGEVWLEEEGSDASQMRAVKVIKKAQMLRHDIDYMRELNTLAHFSKPKVRPMISFVALGGHCALPHPVLPRHGNAIRASLIDGSTDKRVFLWTFSAGMMTMLRFIWLWSIFH